MSFLRAIVLISTVFVLVEYGSALSVASDVKQLYSTLSQDIDMDRSFKKLSRSKRYLSFPDGSSFSIAFCNTVGVIGNPNTAYLSWALNWGLAYDLPNNTFVLDHRFKKLSRPIQKRRQRRDLYQRLEAAMDNMGYNGRSCILRALCESGQRFFGTTTNMIEELIRSVFSLPSTKVLSFEPNDIHDYDAAHRLGKTQVHCSAAYRDCSISLIDLAFGRYSRSMNFM